MKTILFILFLVSLCSCADIYEDITVHNDGSFTVRKTLMMEDKLGALKALGSEFSSAFGDSSVSEAPAPRVKFDSTVQKFITPKSAFDRLPGFISYVAFDSSSDSMIIAGVEVRLKDTTSVSAVHRIFWKSNDSLKASSGSEFSGMVGDSTSTLPEFDLNIAREGNKTTLTFGLPSVNMDTVKIPPLMGKKVFKALLSVLGMYIRVHSTDLQPPIESCQIESFSGYQQWNVPLEKIFDSGTTKRTEAHFIIGNK